MLKAIGCLPLAIHVAGRLLTERHAIGVPDFVSKILKDVEKKVLAGDQPVNIPLGGLQLAERWTINELFAKSTDRLDAVDRERFRVLGTYDRRTKLTLEKMARLWNTDDPLPTALAFASLGLVQPTDGGTFELHELIAAHAASL